jgi:hypothetical protein
MTNDHLTIFLESLKTDVINSIQAKGKIATGQTAQQITIENNGDKAQLQLPGYMRALETGRAPTSQNALPGNPPMIERIKQWCQAKGIPDKAAWAVKKSIDKKGYKGVPGILSEPLGDNNINLRLNQVIGQMADAVAAHVVDSVGLS